MSASPWMGTVDRKMWDEFWTGVLIAGVLATLFIGLVLLVSYLQSDV